jgi:hypothetical protein
MPLQNRVTPLGDIVATPHRGLLTGNRGIIHDPATRTLLNRRWTNQAWIVCVCEFRGRRRDVMGTRSWTELFFLDEAVALAAGHRPCFFCRRDAANAFRAAWADGHNVKNPRASDIDTVLHRERLSGRARAFSSEVDTGSREENASNQKIRARLRFNQKGARPKQIHDLPSPPDMLPDGAMVQFGIDSFVIVGGRARLWSFAGYGPATRVPGEAKLLTPPSTLRALSAGYRPILHPSAVRPDATEVSL